MPTPPPSTVRYSVSGTVADEAGVPIGGALVEIDYTPPPGRLPFVYTRADSAGRYELAFDATVPLGNFPSAVGKIFTYGNNRNYNVQFLPWGTTTIVQDLVIQAEQTITAGESAVVAVKPHSSTCLDLEDWFIPTRRCAQIHVVAPANGTLVIVARPLQDPGAIPIVFSHTSGNYRRQIQGPGTVTMLEVRAGQRYHIFVGAPEGMTSQTYAVSTSLQAPDP